MDPAGLGLVVLLVVAWINRNQWISPFLRWTWRRLRLFWRWIRTDPVATEAAHAIETAAGRIELLCLRVEALEKSQHHAAMAFGPEGRLAWANDAFLRLAGLPLSQVLGGNWINAVHQSDRDALITGWQEAVENGTNFNYCYRYWNFDIGDTLWANADAKVARNPLNGSIVGWVAVVTPLDGPPFSADNTCQAGHWMPPIS